MTEERIGQALPTATGFGARLTIAVLKKHSVAPAAILERAGVSEQDFGWAGLANLFYWIDRKNGFGGFRATQILPFGDPLSFGGYIDFETALYKSLRPRQPA